MNHVCPFCTFSFGYRKGIVNYIYANWWACRDCGGWYSFIPTSSTYSIPVSLLRRTIHDPIRHLDSDAARVLKPRDRPNDHRAARR